MLPLYKTLWNICLLRAGPQDLVKSYYFAMLTIFLGIVVDSFSSSILMPKFSGFEIIKIVVIYNIILLVAVYLLLKLLGFAERSIQTISAIAGSGLLISFFLLPALLLVGYSEKQAEYYAFLIFIDNVWRITVNAHIFRFSFSVNRLFATVLSLSYLLFGVLLAGYLLPS